MVVNHHKQRKTLKVYNQLKSKLSLKQEFLVAWSKKSSANFLSGITRYELKVFVDFIPWTWWCLVRLSWKSGKWNS